MSSPSVDARGSAPEGAPATAREGAPEAAPQSVREPTPPARRTGVERLAVVLVFGALLAGAALWLRWRSPVVPNHGGLPTLQLRRQNFVQEVGADGHLRAVRASPITVPVATQGPLKIAWTKPDGSRVEKGDVVVRFEPTDFEKRLKDGQADRATADARMLKEQTLVDSALRGRARTTQLSQVELEKARDFQNKDPEIFSRNQIIESEIDEELSGARSEHAGASQKIESSLSKNKLDLIAIERKKAQLVVDQAQKGLDSLEVRAPNAGILVFEANWQGNLPSVGDSVWPGQKLATLPLLDVMEVEVFVLEADAGGLKVGKAARVSIEAHPETLYGGKITRVDTLAKRPVRDVPVQYFGVTLELERTDSAVMKPGARVHAVLLLENREALVLPRQAVFDDHGQSIAYRWQNAGFEKVKLVLGPSSLGRVVIEEGLGEGDTIALMDPAGPSETKPKKEPAP
jgi:HlyD family secretion protein